MMALLGAVSSGVLMLVLVGIPIGGAIGYAWAMKFGSDIQDAAEDKLKINWRSVEGLNKSVKFLALYRNCAIMVV